MGTEYDLTLGDEVLVHVYGAGDDHADVEVTHELAAILLFLPFEYRAWNKAGEELRV